VHCWDALVELPAGATSEAASAFFSSLCGCQAGGGRHCELSASRWPRVDSGDTTRHLPRPTAAALHVSVPARRQPDRPPAHPSRLAILISKRGVCFCFACSSKPLSRLVLGAAPSARESAPPSPEACAMHRAFLRDRQLDPRATRYDARKAATRRR
jgi:hypothetical protein